MFCFTSFYVFGLFKQSFEPIIACNLSQVHGDIRENQNF